jgi:RluA family pseudouridine synthase
MHNIKPNHEDLYTPGDGRARDRGLSLPAVASPPDTNPSTLLRVSAAHAGLRADAYLALRLPFLSRTRIKQKIQTGESLLNGGRYATSARLGEGDEITVRWKRVPDLRQPPEIPVLYEDADLIAVDKPAGTASHPSGRIQSGTAIQFIRARLAAETSRRLQAGDADFYPNLVNRLDRFTSGVLLAAKRREALAGMHALAAGGMICKTYLVVVEGGVEPEAGRIELAIEPDTGGRIGVKMRVGPDGAACVTEYRVLRRFAAHTLLSASPLTGRQHQVRLHFASMGHPVWGDLIYKDEELFLKYIANGGEIDETLPPRHLLHAEKSVFVHPMTGEKVEIESRLPRDFMEIMETL